MTKQTRSQKQAFELEQAHTLLQSTLAPSETLEGHTIGSCPDNGFGVIKFAIGLTRRRFIIIKLSPAPKSIYSLYHQFLTKVYRPEGFSGPKDELALKTGKEEIVFQTPIPLETKGFLPEPVVLTADELVLQARSLLNLGALRSAEKVLAEQIQKNPFFATYPPVPELQKEIREARLASHLIIGFSVIAFCFAFYSLLNGNYRSAGDLILWAGIIYALVFHNGLQKRSAWHLIVVFTLGMVLSSVSTNNYMFGVIWLSFAASILALLWEGARRTRIIFCGALFGLGFIGVIAFFAGGRWLSPVSLHNLMIRPGQLFSDDFSQNRGWTSNPEGYQHTLQVADGVLKVALDDHYYPTKDAKAFPVQLGRKIWLLTPPTRFVANEITYEVRTTLPQSKSQGGFGAYCRYNDTLMNQGILFSVEINPNGATYGYFSSQKNDAQLLSDILTTEDLFSGDKWNHVRVVCEKGKMRLWINGKPQTIFEDARIAPFENTGTGIYVNSGFAFEPFSLEIDNVALSYQILKTENLKTQKE